MLLDFNLTNLILGTVIQGYYSINSLCCLVFAILNTMSDCYAQPGYQFHFWNN